MTPSDIARWRAAASIHLDERARQRCPELAEGDIERIERTVASMRACFVRAGDRSRRYNLVVGLGGRRYEVVWDETIRCLVTIWDRNDRHRRRDSLPTDDDRETAAEIDAALKRRLNGAGAPAGGRSAR